MKDRRVAARSATDKTPSSGRKLRSKAVGSIPVAVPGPDEEPWASARLWIDRLSIPAWIIAPDGRIGFANDSLMSFLGLEGAAPRDPGAFMPDDDQRRLTAAVTRAAESGVSEQVVCRLTRSDGVGRRHLVRIQPDAAPAGVIGPLVVVANEIESLGGLTEVDYGEAAFRTPFLADPEPRWIYDLDTLAFVAVNDAAVARYGWSRPEFLTMTLPDIHAPDEIERLMAVIETVRHVSLGRSDVSRHRLKDGRTIEVEVMGHPVIFDGRDARAVLVQDLNGRREVERALAVEKARAASILNSISDGFYSFDNDWRFTFVNEAAETILQRTASELLGRRLWDVFPGAITTKLFLEFDRAKLKGNAAVFTDFYTPLETWIEFRIFPHPEGLTAYFRDATDQWRAERTARERQRLIAIKTLELEEKNKELQQAHARTRRMFEYSLDVICHFDRDGRFVEVSPRSLDVWGYQPEELIGRPHWEFLHPDDRGKMTGGPGGGEPERVGFENRYLRKDGTSVVMQWSSVWSEEDGLFFAIARDMTDRDEVEARLRRAQRLEAVGKLTGGVAHDFNNLLTVILGGVEELAESLGEHSTARDLADTVRRAAERGADLTGRLLAFARRQPLEPRAVDVNRLLGAIDPLLRRALEENIDLEIVRSAGLWSAMIDPGLLEDAILNLCLNGRDSMPNGGRITIEIANVHLGQMYVEAEGDGLKPGQYVMLVVTDEGCGMTPETVANVFEPFFTTKGSGQGNGLGLSMVYGFVKQSNGHVRVYSEVGEGTAVKLYLPRARTRVQEDRAAPPQIEIGGSETILLVEDDDLVRSHVENQLRRLGYRVIVERNGAEALARLPELPPLDLLFTDVVMPGGLTGRQLAEAACALRPGLRVLFTSGYTENAIVHHGRLDPGVHLLSKPYRRKTLAAKVREVLDEPDRGG